LNNVCAGDRRQLWRQSRTLPGSALAAIAAMLAPIRLWRNRSRVRRQLAVMSERELQDMGTCRSLISDEIGKPFWRG
jgi:uncharacterized protein YjiS (DUF1127 family)